MVYSRKKSFKVNTVIVTKSIVILFTLFNVGSCARKCYTWDSFVQVNRARLDSKDFIATLKTYPVKKCKNNQKICFLEEIVGKNKKKTYAGGCTEECVNSYEENNVKKCCNWDKCNHPRSIICRKCMGLEDCSNLNKTFAYCTADKNRCMTQKSWPFVPLPNMEYALMCSKAKRCNSDRLHHRQCCLGDKCNKNAFQNGCIFCDDNDLRHGCNEKGKSYINCAVNEVCGIYSHKDSFDNIIGQFHGCVREDMCTSQLNSSEELLYFIRRQRNHHNDINFGYECCVGKMCNKLKYIHNSVNISCYVCNDLFSTDNHPQCDMESEWTIETHCTQCLMARYKLNNLGNWYYKRECILNSNYKLNKNTNREYSYLCQSNICNKSPVDHITNNNSFIFYRDILSCYQCNDDVTEEELRNNFNKMRHESDQNKKWRILKTRCLKRSYVQKICPSMQYRYCYIEINLNTTLIRAGCRTFEKQSTKNVFNVHCIHNICNVNVQNECYACSNRLVGTPACFTPQLYICEWSEKCWARRMRKSINHDWIYSYGCTSQRQKGKKLTNRCKADLINTDIYQVNCCSSWRCNSPIADFYDRRLESQKVYGFWEGYMVSNKTQFMGLTVISGVIGIMLAALAVLIKTRDQQKVYITQVETMLNNSSVFIRKDKVASTMSRLNKSSLMFDKCHKSENVN